MSKASLRAQAAVRWAFLRDWITTLQQHLYYHEREELECGSLHSELKSFCVYIPWPVETTDEYAMEVTKLREAMELVGLALELDKTLWQLIAQEGNPSIAQFDPDDYDDGDLTPRYLIKAYWRDAKVIGDDLESITVVEQLLLTSVLSQAYDDARETVLSMDTRGRLTQFQIPVSILFTPNARTRTKANTYLAMASRVTEEVSRRSDRIEPHDVHGPNAYAFTLSSVVFHPWEFTVAFDADGVDGIETFTTALLTHGVALPEIALQLAGSDPLALGRLLQTICRRSSTASTAAVPSATVDTLMVTNTTLPQFKALCSAIASSPSLTRLHLYAAFNGQRTLKWRALGFALLSHMSQSSVRELFIEDRELLMRDAVALQQPAVSLHPLQDLAVTRAVANKQYEPVDYTVRLCEDAKIKLTIEGEEMRLD